MATFDANSVCAPKSVSMPAHTVRAKASPTFSTTQERSRDEPPSPPPQPPPSPVGWSRPIMDGSLDLELVSLYHLWYAHLTNMPSLLPWIFRHQIARRRAPIGERPASQHLWRHISDGHRFALALYLSFGFVVKISLLPRWCMESGCRFTFGPGFAAELLLIPGRIFLHMHPGLY